MRCHFIQLRCYREFLEKVLSSVVDQKLEMSGFCWNLDVNVRAFIVTSTALRMEVLPIRLLRPAGDQQTSFASPC